MARNELREIVLAKFQHIQQGIDQPVWVSGVQVTELLKSHNPSSIRVALLLLVDDEVLVRERRRGRGKTGRTGQSAWYALAEVPAEK